MITFVFWLILAFSGIVFILCLKKRGITCGTVLQGIYLMYYMMVPTFVYTFYESVVEEIQFISPHIHTLIGASMYDEFIAILAIVIGYLLITLYNLSRKRQAELSWVETDTYKAYMGDKVYLFGIFASVFGGVCLLYVFYELGGIVSALKLATEIRGYLSDNTKYLSAVGAMCTTLAAFLPCGTICLYAGMDIKTGKKISIFFLISLILSVLYFLFDAGRGPLVIFFICLFMGYLKKRQKKIGWRMVLIFIAVVLTSSTIGDLMTAIAGGNFESSKTEWDLAKDFYSTIADLVFPYANILNISKLIADSGLRHGLDYLIWVFSIVPARLLALVGIRVPSFTLVTTDVSYFYINQGLTTGGTPADFVTTGMLQMHYIGVIINTVLWLWLCGKVDSVLKMVPNSMYSLNFRYFFIAYSLITSNDPSTIAKSNLQFIILLLFLFYYQRKYRYRSKCS